MTTEETPTPEQEKIDIPQDVMDVIQENALRKASNYLGESKTGDLVVRFHQDSIRLYMLDPTVTEMPEEDATTPDPNIVLIPEYVEHGGYYYKLMFNMNRVAAKQFAKQVKGFSLTPFNI